MLFIYRRDRDGGLEAKEESHDADDEMDDDGDQKFEEAFLRKKDHERDLKVSQSKVC